MLSAGHGPLFFYSRPEDQFMTMNGARAPIGSVPLFKIRSPGAPPASHRQSDTPGHGRFFLNGRNDRGEQFGVERMQGEIRA
jgi:hypothetical protein